MACKNDVRKGIYNEVARELTDNRYTFTRLDDNTIQINGRVDNSKTKAQNRASAKAIAKELVKRIYNSFEGHVSGYISEVSLYDPITVTFKASEAYVDWVYNNLPSNQQVDGEETDNVERSHILNDTGINTHEQLTLFSPAEEEPVKGLFAKYLDFKKIQVRELEKRIAEIERKRKVTNISTEELTKLKNLEREIKLTLDGNFEMGIMGIKQEIKKLEKNAESLSVQYYSEKDLQRLSRLVNSNDLDDLNEAQRIVDFWNSAADFDWRPNTKEDFNPFFTVEEIFLEDDDGKLTPNHRLSEEARNQFKAWAAKANDFKGTIENKKVQLMVDTINNDNSVIKTYGGQKFSFEDLTYTEKGLKDAHWVSMWTMDITQGIASHNGMIPQVMFSYLANSFEKKLSWAREIEEKIDRMNPGVQKELVRLGYTVRALGIKGFTGASYNLFKEITKEGNETGGIVQRFVKEFYDAQSKAMNTFRTSFEEAKLIEDTSTRNNRFNKLFEELKRWRRNNTIIIDISKVPEIASDPNFTEFSAVGDSAYKNELIKIIGERGYKEEIEKQKKLLRNYQSEKQSMIDTAMQLEGKATFDELSDKVKNELKYWENNHSPLRGIQDYNSATGIFFGNRKSNNFMDFNHFIPRKTKVNLVANTTTNNYEFEDTGIATGNYDKNFETIENNKTLSDFYDVVKEVVDSIRENMPPELQRKVASNTLPGLFKTSAEIIADKNTGVLSALFLSFKHMIERFRVSFGVQKQSDLSYAEPIDPETGKAPSRVNDGFLQGNSKAVEDRMTIEKIKFLQAYNKNRIEGARLNKIKRFSMVTLSGLNVEALTLLAQYANIDINQADINAGRIDKIRAVVGDQVEIGKYIRDFSLHSVVQSQSFDLGKLTKYFSNMTMMYAARQEALPILEIMKKHYQKIKDPHTNNTGVQIKHGPTGKYMQVGLRTNANKQMDDWFERVVLDNYGLKHAGVHGKEDEEAFFGKSIYTAEERKKLNEINELISNTTDEAEKEKLEALKRQMGKTRTWTAAVDNLLSWIRTLRLGYNLSSMSTNFLEGVTSNMILAASDQYFNPDEIFYGYHVAKLSFLKNISFGKLEHPLATKNRKLMDRHANLVDSKNELQKSSIRTTADRAEWLNPHAGNQRVEFVNQSPLMIAILRTIKIKDKSGKESSVWDAHTKDGHLKDEFKTEENIENWENLTGSQYLDYKQKLKKVVGIAHGLGYDEMRGMMAKSNSVGKAFMMFKTWLPSAIYQRFATEQDDIQAGVKGFKGRYFSYTPTTAGLHVAAVGISLFAFPIGAILGVGTWAAMAAMNKGVKTDVGMLRQTIEVSKILAKKMIGMPVNLIVGKKVIGVGTKGFDSWVGKGEFTQMDADNLKSNMSDIALQLAWLAMILLTKSLFWDDDDEKDSTERITHNIVVNKLMQLSSQAAMYINPLDKNNVISSTLGNIAVYKYLEDVGKFTIAVAKWVNGESDDIATGVNAGESRMGNTFSKLVLPGMFKDVFGERMLGFGDQADKVFVESAWHNSRFLKFRSEETFDKQDNTGDRASRKKELEELPLEEFDGNNKEEQKKNKDKYIRNKLNEELPTPARLKKLGMTREQFEEQAQ